MDIEETICDSITRAEDGIKFLPNDVIEQLTNEVNVRAHISTNYHDPSNTADTESLVRYVTNTIRPAKRVFLIVVYCGHLQYLKLLQAAHFYDTDLPIESKWDAIEKRYNVYTKSVAEPQGSDRKLWDCFFPWRRNVEAFDDRQWYFMAPVFGAGIFDYRLSPRCPLPITSKSAQETKKVGLSGGVISVTIHSAHIQAEYRDKPVASKEMHPGMKAYYEQECKALRVIHELDHPHLIQPLAAYTRGTQSGFFFPWAEGGNLLEYWTTHARPEGEAGIRWVLNQLCGLSEAAEALHGKDCRHRDLKPANILLFTSEGQAPGNLRIADVGLAKIHQDNTKRREILEIITSARTSTTRYEAPELTQIHLQQAKQLSRVFDVWCLGCVFLEFLIWTVYGQSEVRNFLNTTLTFWEGSPGHYQLHPRVEQMIKKMQSDLDVVRSETALKHCLDFVAKRMLEPEYRDRANASQTCIRFRSIRDHESSGNEYLSNRTATVSEVTSIHSPTTDSLNANELEIPMLFNRGEESNVMDQEATALNDEWEPMIDNLFAQDLFNIIRSDQPSVQKPFSELCSECKDIGTTDFVFCDKMKHIMGRSKVCALCHMLYQAAKEIGVDDDEVLRCRRVESTIRMEPHGPILLSIFSDPNDHDFGPTSTQLGHAQLSRPFSEFQMTLFKQWIRVCDEQHNHLFKSETKLPTRVLDVGTKDQPSLCLQHNEGSASGQYVALSHCWGAAQNIKTLRGNFDSFKQCIKLGELPKTFKDAVEVTRMLGFRYLWIDSLCIVQDDPVDWELEAASMEHVFSCANVTIAASSARSSSEGLQLDSREQSPVLTVKSPSGGTVFIRRSIDNFRRDVEESVLNQRGWVLQERALARRTIHFTSTQAYWECGSGIHCESMIKLVNSKAAFLGDSNFPNSALHYFKGARILLFQNLYETYSRLKFSHVSDRSVAIRGLEERLIKTFDTKGGFGVFSRYLQRSLLWKRPEGSVLLPITSTMNKHIPSWSWMSYSGPISYLAAPFDRVDWNTNVHAPFNSESGRQQHWKAGRDDVVAQVLQGRMRKLSGDAKRLEEKIVFDEKGRSEMAGLCCIILGTDKPSGSTGNVYHYVLIIEPVSSGETKQYFRVGVGRLLPNDLSEEDAEVVVF